jgi:two-component system NtrC family response regulator
MTPNKPEFHQIMKEFKRRSSSGLKPLRLVRGEYLMKVENRYLRKLYVLTDGSLKKAVEISGLSRSQLYSLLKKHSLHWHK